MPTAENKVTVLAATMTSGWVGRASFVFMISPLQDVKATDTDVPFGGKFV
jgi:hypothetical protein